MTEIRTKKDIKDEIEYLEYKLSFNDTHIYKPTYSNLEIKRMIKYLGEGMLLNEKELQKEIDRLFKLKNRTIIVQDKLRSFCYIINGVDSCNNDHHIMD